MVLNFGTVHHPHARNISFRFAEEISATPTPFASFAPKAIWVQAGAGCSAEKCKWLKNGVVFLNSNGLGCASHSTPDDPVFIPPAQASAAFAMAEDMEKVFASESAVLKL